MERVKQFVLQHFEGVLISVIFLATYGATHFVGEKLLSLTSFISLRWLRVITWDAMEKFIAKAGKQFDPKLMGTFARVVLEQLESSSCQEEKSDD